MMINKSELWQSSASIENLKKRASIIKEIRAFFDNRNCYEVTTPVLSQFGNTDPQLDSFVVANTGYLNTSPEFHMKRLLASGSGAIYQICSAFRSEEQGKKHNSEFTMLEWYRPNWDISKLMAEMVELLHEIFPRKEVVELTYNQALKQFTGLDYFKDSTEQIDTIARSLLGDIPQDLSRDDLLDLLFCTVVEKQLPQNKWCFITQYPPSQASLAKKSLNDDSQEVAMRFELYLNSVELANGYWELTDWQEQLQRFEADNLSREINNKPQIKIDELLIEALKNKMPECSGVALGIDRLLMLAMEESEIKQVMSFDTSRS